MKSILLYAAISIGLLASCQNGEENGNGGGKGPKSEAEKKVSKRDYSITKAISYSDLFIDSTVMEKYFLDNKLSDSIKRRMRSFYNTRNYQYAWFTGEGLTEQARGFWNLHEYVTTYDIDTTLRDKTLQKKMDDLIAESDLSVNASNKEYQNLELKLTSHFVRYILNNYEKGFVKRKEMERFIPRKKEDALYLADSIINKKHKDDKYFEDVNPNYGKLKDFLSKYYAIAKQGGWPKVTMTEKSLKKGAASPAVAQIKRRLFATGDLQVNDTTQVFNDTLDIAVKNFQQRYGLKPDGIVTTALIKEMNVPIEVRIQQIIMNMERMRWMPEPHENGNLIVVNIPEFVLHVFEGNKKAFDMNVVVGKEGHNTMMFSGDLNQVVFSPYWNVPPSIVKNEILPAMNRNPGYLSGQNMEMTSNGGGLPSIRQRPGPGNALGKVKFLFPNSFNIYFHDTPAKSLFQKDKRAYSHGCIRLAEPEKMAQYLLRNHPEWTHEKINAAMNSGSEKYVKLKNPVPVVITYYTAWVDENGQLNFREDIYDHDKKQLQKMFINAAT